MLEFLKGGYSSPVLQALIHPFGNRGVGLLAWLTSSSCYSCSSCGLCFFKRCCRSFCCSFEESCGRISSVLIASFFYQCCLSRGLQVIICLVSLEIHCWLEHFGQQLSKDFVRPPVIFTYARKKIGKELIIEGEASSNGYQKLFKQLFVVSYYGYLWFKYTVVQAYIGWNVFQEGLVFMYEVCVLSGEGAILVVLGYNFNCI